MQQFYSFQSQIFDIISINRLLASQVKVKVEVLFASKVWTADGLEKRPVLGQQRFVEILCGRLS